MTAFFLTLVVGILGWIAGNNSARIEVLRDINRRAHRAADPESLYQLGKAVARNAPFPTMNRRLYVWHTYFKELLK